MEFQYHADLTRPALRAAGFRPGSASLVVWGNWATDLWTLESLAHTPRGKLVATRHFTNLTTPELVTAAWELLGGERVLGIVEAPTVGMALYELGQLLHNVQDFYAHSNWVELCLAAGCGPGTVPTWEAGLPPGVQLDDLITAYYPDAIAPRPEWGHRLLHKDYPGCAGGETIFRAAMGVAGRATEQWLGRVLAELSPLQRDALLGISRTPITIRGLMLATALADRLGIPRWMAGGPPPWQYHVLAGAAVK